ncbi:alpha 1,2 mannosyltransferase [Ascosphaera acerosa]|nr:alpha 1,2 mannosyltransferase [Ascosphaera acerosa]
MFRRLYLLLLLVRIYFVFAPSYIHPDEHFQGPEIITSQIYGFPSSPPWEFTSTAPIRSVLPLYIAYGLPLTCLKWIWGELGYGDAPPPELVYYAIRVIFFLWTFILEDWAITELAISHRKRRQALLLVASSYVTWVHQSHSLSNSLETLAVIWALVLIKRVKENQNRPFSAFCIGMSAMITAFCAVCADTAFYAPAEPGTSVMSRVHRTPVLTPLNNFKYNSQSTNLAEHGIHSRLHHFLVNMPELLGPAYLLLLYTIATMQSSSWFSLKTPRAMAALSGAAALSLFPHQEARFLLPCVPLLLTCLKKPLSRTYVAIWIAFNSIFGILMGVYHQGGVVPTTLQLPHIVRDTLQTDGPTNVEVVWWKAYRAPNWLLGNTSLTFTIHDLGGANFDTVLGRLEALVPSCQTLATEEHLHYLALLVAPASATVLDAYVTASASDQEPSPTHLLASERLALHLLSTYRNHIGLDDLDFAEDGVLPTLNRVIGRRGLNVWQVTRQCQEAVPHHHRAVSVDVTAIAVTPSIEAGAPR